MLIPDPCWEIPARDSRTVMKETDERRERAKAAVRPPSPAPTITMCMFSRFRETARQNQSSSGFFGLAGVENG